MTPILVASLERFKHYWQRLFRSNPRFNQFIVEYQQGLMAALLAISGIAIVLTLLVELLLSRNVSWQIWLLSLGLVGLYSVLLRQRRLSITGMVYSATAGIFAIAFSSPERTIQVLYFVCYLLLISCLFLPLQRTLSVIAVQLGGLLASAFFVAEGAQIYKGPLPFYMVCALISILVVYDFRALFTDYLDRLAESETRYRMVSKLVSDYAFFVRFKPDGGMSYEWVTDAITQITGYTPDEVSFNLSQYYHPDDAPRMKADLEAVRRGESNSGEYRIVTKTGDLRWLLIYRQAVKEDGQVVGYYGSVTDITERKATEQQRLELSLEQERVHSMIQFASAFSHSFRNVLSSIEANRHIIQRTLDSSMPPTVETHLGKISENISKLHSQLDNMTIVSRLMTHPAQPIQLAQVLETLIPHYRNLAQAKQVRLHYQPAAQLPLVSTHLEDARRVIDYLLKNAIQRTSPAGEVTVYTSVNERCVCLMVLDMGETIPPDKLTSIFDFFYHAGEMNDITQSGAALGLTLSRIVAEHYGGSLTTQSVVGQGNRFEFSLPIA
jgi:PAS domain S-box-containing protein